MWIFENYKRDFLFLYLPGILAFILFENIHEKTILALILSFIVYQVIDVGHVYSTVWRTIFDKDELKSSNRYIVTPILLFIIISLWFHFQLPYFWSFVGYFTIYHNLRQGFGVMKWYEKKNLSRIANNLNFYLLTFLPIILFHFRDDSFEVLYYTSQKDFLYTEHNPFVLDLLFFNITIPNIFFLVIGSIYILSIFKTILNEIQYFYISKKIEISRILYLIYFSLIYCYSFILSDNILEMSGALIASHGVPYLFMIHYSMLKTRKIPIKKTFIMVFLVALLGGIINFIYESNMDNAYNYTNLNVTLLELIIILFYVVPILCHFIWDASIWRHNNKNAKIIYNDEKVYE